MIKLPGTRPVLHRPDYDNLDEIAKGIAFVIQLQPTQLRTTNVNEINMRRYVINAIWVQVYKDWNNLWKAVHRYVFAHLLGLNEIYVWFHAPKN